MPVKVDENLCGFCFGCAAICPENLYIVENDHLLIADGCTDCGWCSECCPVKAILIIK